MTDRTDSTECVPYLVEIERDDDEVRVYPAHFVTLTPDFVFVRDPAGGFANLPTRSVRSARVTVQDLPPTMPNAPEPEPPPESEPEPDSLQALLTRRATSHDYLVIVKPGIIDPYQILSRHRIDSDSLYRIASWGFAATLTGLQLENPAVAGGPALPEDPDIDRIEPDPDRLAPHFRTPQEQRVDGEYLVNVRRSGDPLTVAARAGVSPGHVFDIISAFGGGMTDAQVQALRQDPDVVSIEDNALVGLDS